MRLRKYRRGSRFYRRRFDSEGSRDELYVRCTKRGLGGEGAWIEVVLYEWVDYTDAVNRGFGHWSKLDKQYFDLDEVIERADKVLGYGYTDYDIQKYIDEEVRGRLLPEFEVPIDEINESSIESMVDRVYQMVKDKVGREVPVEVMS